LVALVITHTAHLFQNHFSGDLSAA